MREHGYELYVKERKNSSTLAHVDDFAGKDGEGGMNQKIFQEWYDHYPSQKKGYINRASSAKGEQTCWLHFAKPSEIIAAKTRKEVEQCNMNDHGYEYFYAEWKKKGVMGGYQPSIDQSYFSMWVQMPPEEKKPYIDKAIAKKGEAACKRMFNKYELKRPFGEISDDEDGEGSGNADFASNAGDPDSDDIDSDEEFEGVRMDESPSQVRAKIKRYIANTGCTRKKFQDDAGISAHSFTSFMRATGQNGSGTNCYFDLWKFFKKRENKGLPAVPKKEKEPAAKKAKTATSAEDKKKEAEKKKKEDEKWDVSDIHLDGEEDDSMPIYDTCDGIRKKIRAHEKTAGYVQAAFCRTLTAQMSSGVTVTGATLKSFLSKKGPRDGAASSSFYAAYVYVEKLKIKQGKPKTEKREVMEKKWGNREYSSPGVPRKAKEMYLGFADDAIYEDEYGCPVIVRGGRRR